MPKKGAGGKRHKKGKKFDDDIKVEAPHKDPDSQEYAQVTKMLGNGRVEAVFLDSNRTRKLCIIPGKFKKRRIWINMGDLILLGIRSFEDGKCDIMYKYSDAEVRQLQKHGEISSNYQVGGDLVANMENDDEDAGGFVFGDDSEEEVDLADL